MGELSIIPAYDRLDDIRELFEEYTRWLGVDLSFQNYQAELDGLPGKYATPDGRLYLALMGEMPAGCMAMRRFDLTRCEVKRLFVRNDFRGKGIAQALCAKVLEDALETGYRSAVLDTMASMKGAIGLYSKMGFVEIEPYYHNPYTDIVFMEKKLIY